MITTPFIDSLIPQGANYAYQLKDKAFELSEKDCLSAHFLAPLSILASSSLSLLNATFFAGKTIAYTALGLVTCNNFSHLSAIPSLIYSSASSFLFFALGVSMFVLGLLFPQLVFSYFKGGAPEQPPPQAPQPQNIPSSVVRPETPPPPPIMPRAASPPVSPRRPDPVSRPPQSELPYFVVEEPPEDYRFESKSYVPDVAMAPGTFARVSSHFVDDPNLPEKLEKYEIQRAQMRKHFTRKFGSIDALIQKYEGQDYAELLRIFNSDIMEPFYRDARYWYQYFIPKLDEFISSPAYQLDIAVQVRELCRIRWTEIRSTGYFDHIVRGMRKAYLHAANGGHLVEVPKLTGETFMEHIIALNGQIEHAPLGVRKSTAAITTQKLQGSLGVEDFTGKRNTPNIRSIQQWKGEQGVRLVKSLRHGCPTFGGSYWKIPVHILSNVLSDYIPEWMHVSSGEGIVPNYREMVRALSERGEGVLFTCLQRNKPNSFNQKVESERARVQALIAEQKQHNNFFVLVQAMEGALFERKGPYSKISGYSELIEVLCKAFIQAERHCIPTCLANDPEYCTVTLPQLFHEVHSLFFEGDEIKSNEDWTSFILLCYVFQRQDLQFRLERLTGLTLAVKTNPCKDYLDRGGCAALCESMVNALILGKLDDHEWMAGQVAHALGPPIAVKKQGVIHKRLEQAKAVHERLFAISQDQVRLERLRQFRFEGGWQIASDVIPPDNEDLVDDGG